LAGNTLVGILDLFRKENLSYYGSSSYVHVDKLIKSERNLLIISPYIDDYYARFLLRHSRGKRIYVLSSSIAQTAAKKLNSSSVPGAIALVWISASANLIVLYLGKFSSIFAVASISVAIVYFIASLFSRRNIRLKTPREFVHAKLYVGDSAAIEGSANLTFSGMHKNIEHISVTRNERKIAELKEQFWKLWNSA
jgi:phosphatidylserine/phosphatidylglycerophosphate/cardiolipin synthase-like enzyme